MKCIVLSGATVPFQALVDTIDENFVRELRRFGYTDIEVQHGYAKTGQIGGVEYFAFDADISRRVQSAQLVISHAGTGSILDALERGDGVAARKVIVVVNSSLMDNHQLEVASKLEQLSCLYVCGSPSSLSQALPLVMNRKFLKLESASSLQPLVNEELLRFGTYAHTRKHI